MLKPNLIRPKRFSFSDVIAFTIPAILLCAISAVTTLRLTDRPAPDVMAAPATPIVNGTFDTAPGTLTGRALHTDAGDVQLSGVTTLGTTAGAMLGHVDPGHIEIQTQQFYVTPAERIRMESTLTVGNYNDPRLIRDRADRECLAHIDGGHGLTGDIGLSSFGGSCRLVFGYAAPYNFNCTFDVGLVDPATIGAVDISGFYFTFEPSNAQRHIRYVCR